MIHRRGAIPALLLLGLIVFGFVFQAIRGPATAASPSGAASATPAPDPAAALPVIRSLSAVQRAYAAGDVRALCRPGALLDPAVIRQEHPRSGDCQSGLETLMSEVPRLRFTVQSLRLGPDLATATVSTSAGAGERVELVRRGQRWLLSFSGGADPLPVLAGTN
jgi:hypothetical protein